MQSTIWADALALTAKRGRVYGPVNLEIGEGVTVLCGPSGSGRTSALLTLAGRMRPSSGTAEVLGYALPRQARSVQKKTSIAGFDDIDDLEVSVSVGAAVRERRAWLAPWWSIVKRPSNSSFAELAQPIFGDVPIPAVNTTIWDLNELQSMLLRVTLAQMSNPSVLFVDQIEQVHEPRSRRILWERLGALAETGTAVVVAATEPEPQLWTGLSSQPTVISLTEDN
ncbi:ATP-binding cassette domain-containing protein [Glaciibacter psychrotolerans]|uniref:Energy-coupling factor transporter ATP-binding protein EcfA2 n=1 Tax=Glaciibacter psychrotolerans TaxID=670054 RepID=A0A7Z0EGK2_9MICO|nr:ATP-binding cassette domain-containing protein [Leifsonia psychrotolerans]NYJ21264.1 energy-coupling factor transporter ATP-binding protein EcfA2 [Leifsonia psychrotolerans]